MNNERKRKIFHIEPFKRPVRIDPNYADKTWKIIEHGIDQIYNHDARDVSIQQLYGHAYNMVLFKFGEKLYSGLVATMTTHLQDIAKSVEAAQGCSFLKELSKKWNDHIKALEMIGMILTYMNMTYIPSTQKTPVHELGLNLWTETVIYSSQIRTRLLNTLLELVHSERTGEVIDRGIMRDITKMLMDLGPSVYGQEFETQFLQVSAEFYRVESEKLIECCDCGDYLKKAERRLNEEMDRVSHYLDPMTEKKITNVVEKEMIENHMLRLIHMENSGLVHMFCDHKYEDLGRMYNLFRHVTDGLSKIREVMTEHIKESGRQFVNDPERLKNPNGFVQRLLHERDKYDKIINLAFDGDKSFQNALKASFEYVIYINCASPEFISLFVDDRLRKYAKGSEPEKQETREGELRRTESAIFTQQ